MLAGHESNRITQLPSTILGPSLQSRAEIPLHRIQQPSDHMLRAIGNELLRHEEDLGVDPEVTTQTGYPDFTKPLAPGEPLATEVLGAEKGQEQEPEQAKSTIKKRSVPLTLDYYANRQKISANRAASDRTRRIVNNSR